LHTPIAKLLLGDLQPLMLAAVLYLGSGVGLLVWMPVRHARDRGADKGAPITRQDFPWLSGAVFFGGIAGPVLLMTGLVNTPASSALLAWLVFKENFDRRIFAGMVLIVCGSMLLSWRADAVAGVPWGALAIVGVCLCWAIDNNLTRKVSASDPVQIAALKGLVAGAVARRPA
jgi:drug/metabolite transporter (DMT)-like permease